MARDWIYSAGLCRAARILDPLHTKFRCWHLAVGIWPAHERLLSGVDLSLDAGSAAITTGAAGSDALPLSALLAPKLTAGIRWRRRAVGFSYAEHMSADVD